MASTGVKAGRSVRNPLTLSVDQSVCLTPTKNTKNKQKTTQTEQLSYDERLKLARQKLLSDAPEHKPNLQTVSTTHSKPEIVQNNTSYEARLKSIRQKLLTDMNLPPWDDLTSSKDSTSLKVTRLLVLNKTQLQNTPMCIDPASPTEAVRTKNREASVFKDKIPPQTEEEQDNKTTIFEFHQNEVLTDSVFFADDTEQVSDDTDDALETALLATDTHGPKKVIYTAPRALPFSTKAYIKVTFTPHELPYGIKDVAGENATKTESWIQNNAMEHYLMLQSQAREYEAKQGATYRSITHDA